MSFGEVANYLFVIFIALTNGMPQDDAAATQQQPETLPFLQFTNGGIRVNLGGYHAEAGLGGLLRGNSGGGLHASVGTPWGAHAGAGLGGHLSGENGSLGGGLYARAGLGRGRPEAAAGLGGKLDGNGRSFSPISGGMYAGATPGAGPGRAVYLGGGLAHEIDTLAGVDTPDLARASPRTGAATRETDAAAGANATEATKTKATTKGRTNIQIIPSRSKSVQKEKERMALEAAALSTDTSAGGRIKSQDKEVRRAVLYPVVPPVPEVGRLETFRTGPPVKSIEKNVVAFASTDNAVRANTSTNVIATVEKNPGTLTPKPVYPRWYLRKRFWTAPRKVIYVTPTAADSQGAPSDVVDGIFAGAVGDGGAVTVEKGYTSGSLFDDIFNIPISTLTAINQFLKNNIG